MYHLKIPEFQSTVANKEDRINILILELNAESVSFSSETSTNYRVARLDTFCEFAAPPPQSCSESVRIRTSPPFLFV